MENKVATEHTFTRENSDASIPGSGATATPTGQGTAPGVDPLDQFFAQPPVAAAAARRTAISPVNLDVDGLKAAILGLNARKPSISVFGVTNDEGKRFLDKEVKRALREIAADPAKLFDVEESDVHFKVVMFAAVRTACTQKGYYAVQGSFNEECLGNIPSLNLGIATAREEILGGFPGNGGINLGVRITEEGRKALDKSLSVAVLTVANSPELYNVTKANAHFESSAVAAGFGINANPEFATSDVEYTRKKVVKRVAEQLAGKGASYDTVAAITAQITPHIQAALRTPDGGNLLNDLSKEGIAALNKGLATAIETTRLPVVDPAERANYNTFLIESIAIGEGTVTVTPTAEYAELKAQEAARLEREATARTKAAAAKVEAENAKKLEAERQAEEKRQAAQRQADAKAEKKRLAAEEAAKNPSWFARTFRGVKPALSTSGQPLTDDDFVHVGDGGVEGIVKQLGHGASAAAATDRDSSPVSSDHGSGFPGALSRHQAVVAGAADDATNVGLNRSLSSSGFGEFVAAPKAAPTAAPTEGQREADAALAIQSAQRQRIARAKVTELKKARDAGLASTEEGGEPLSHVERVLSRRESQEGLGAAAGVSPTTHAETEEARRAQGGSQGINLADL